MPHCHGFPTGQPAWDVISSSDAGGDADRILKFVAWYPVLLGDDIEWLAGAE